MIRRQVVTFGPISANANYDAIRNIPPETYATAIGKIVRALGANPISGVEDLPEGLRRWLLFALALLFRNRAGVDQQTIDHLVDYAPQATTTPDQSPGPFEHEVLRACGWLEKALTARLQAPTGGDLQEVRDQYRPKPTVSGSVEIGPLNERVLSEELPTALEQLILSQLKFWEEREPFPLETQKTVATIVQDSAKAFFAPYADGARGNKLSGGFHYPDKVFSVTDKPPTQEQRMVWLRNRAQIIGWDKSKGPSLFERAQYDAQRPQDGVVLEHIFSNLEKLGTIQVYLDFLVTHTAVTRHGEDVGVVTEVPTDDVVARRWLSTRTLCHELMHVLVHPNFVAMATQIKVPQVVREGFVDMFAQDLYENMAGKSKGKPPPETTVGYGDAGVRALAIRAKVGDDNARAAFFLGSVNLVGLEMGMGNNGNDL